MRNNQEMYRIFMEHMVGAVVGKDIFHKWCYFQVPSKYVTASDEAMAMLIFANNYDIWEEMALRLADGETKVKIDDCTSFHRYFKDGKGRGRSWSAEGKRYYNDMFDKVIEDRNIRGEDFDNYFFEQMRDEDTSTTERRKEARKTKARLGKEVVVRCRNDFSQQMLMDEITDVTGV
jgi:3-oxoacyl-[acyl-carrier-protein] synthase III